MYDGLGYFVALTGTSFSRPSNVPPTDFCTAANMMNVFLYRGAARSIQSSGYLRLLFSTITLSLTRWAAQRIAWLCNYLDHEPTDSHSHTWCVSYYAQPGLVGLKVAAEAGVQRAPVVPSQLPTANTATMAPSGGRFDEETKPYDADTMDRNLTTDFRGSSDRLPSEFDVEVRLDRSLLMGPRSTIEEQSGRAVYSPSHTQRSAWDRAPGSRV